MDADKKKAKRLKREERRRQALLKQAGASHGTAHDADEAVGGSRQLEHAPGGGMHEAAEKKAVKRKDFAARGGEGGAGKPKKKKMQASPHSGAGPAGAGKGGGGARGGFLEIVGEAIGAQGDSKKAADR